MSDSASAMEALERFRQRMEADGPAAAVPAVLMLAVLGLAHRWLLAGEEEFTHEAAAQEIIRAVLLAQRSRRPR